MLAPIVTACGKGGIVTKAGGVVMWALLHWQV